jgi:CDP-paratose 2-epimerase
MYGGRQFPTFDQGWIGWFCQKALECKNSVDKERFSISGNGKQVRDVLHAYDLISLYNSALDASDNICGQAFNIGGGIENSLSLLELFSILNSKLKIDLEYEQLPVRKSDQRIFVADITKVAENFLWKPKIGFNDGIDLMLHWLGANA